MDGDEDMPSRGPARTALPSLRRLVAIAAAVVVVSVVVGLVVTMTGGVPARGSLFLDRFSMAVAGFALLTVLYGYRERASTSTAVWIVASLALGALSAWWIASWNGFPHTMQTIVALLGGIMITALSWIVLTSGVQSPTRAREPAPSIGTTAPVTVDVSMLVTLSLIGVLVLVALYPSVLGANTLRVLPCETVVGSSDNAAALAGPCPHAPLYRELVAALLGIDLAQTRLLNVALGLLVVLLTFIIGRRIIGTAAGLIAAVAVAIHPLHTIMSSIAGPAGVQSALALLILLVGTSASHSGGRHLHALLGIMCGVSLGLGRGGLAISITALALLYRDRRSLDTMDLGRGHRGPPSGLAINRVLATAFLALFLLVPWDAAQELLESSSVQGAGPDADDTFLTGWPLSSAGVYLSSDAPTAVLYILIAAVVAAVIHGMRRGSPLERGLSLLIVANVLTAAPGGQIALSTLAVLIAPCALLLTSLAVDLTKDRSGWWQTAAIITWFVVVLYLGDATSSIIAILDSDTYGDAAVLLGTVMGPTDLVASHNSPILQHHMGDRATVVPIHQWYERSDPDADYVLLASWPEYQRSGIPARSPHDVSDAPHVAFLGVTDPELTLVLPLTNATYTTGAGLGPGSHRVLISEERFTPVIDDGAGTARRRTASKLAYVYFRPPPWLRLDESGQPGYDLRVRLELSHDIPANGSVAIGLKNSPFNEAWSWVYVHRMEGQRGRYVLDLLVPPEQYRVGESGLVQLLINGAENGEVELYSASFSVSPGFSLVDGLSSGSGRIWLLQDRFSPVATEGNVSYRRPVSNLTYVYFIPPQWIDTDDNGRPEAPLGIRLRLAHELAEGETAHITIKKSRRRSDWAWFSLGTLSGKRSWYDLDLTVEPEQYSVTEDGFIQLLIREGEGLDIKLEGVTFLRPPGPWEGVPS